MIVVLVTLRLVSVALLCLRSLACCWKESAPLVRPPPRDIDSSGGGGGGGAREEGLTVLTSIVFNYLEKTPLLGLAPSLYKDFARR